MTFTDVFIRRPVMASVVGLLILVVGMRAILALEVLQYPATSGTVATVTTSYPGADSGLVKGFVTTPLQQAIAEADGIDYLAATSVQGLSTIDAHMRLDYDPKSAVAEIQAKVASQRTVLPTAAEDPVIDATTGDATALKCCRACVPSFPATCRHIYRTTQVYLSAIRSTRSSRPWPPRPTYSSRTFGGRGTAGIDRRRLPDVFDGILDKSVDATGDGANYRVGGG